MILTNLQRLTTNHINRITINHINRMAINHIKRLVEIDFPSIATSEFLYPFRAMRTTKM